MMKNTIGVVSAKSTVRRNHTGLMSPKAKPNKRASSSERLSTLRRRLSKIFQRPMVLT